MKKKNFLLFILCFLPSILFSQTIKKETVNTVESTQHTTSIIHSEPLIEIIPFLEKNPLPKNEKSSPTLFYIIDDKPVDYKTYIYYIQSKK